MTSMKGATKIIGGMNRSMNLPGLSKIAQDFERENDIMEQRQEIMEDAIDDALGDPAEEEESEETVNQILDELGIDLNAKVRLRLSNIFSVLTWQSSVKRLLVFNLTQRLKLESLKLLAVETTISKHDLRVFANDYKKNLSITIYWSIQGVYQVDDVPP